VIGHVKNEGHLGRCWLKGREGDAANVVLSAIGYNFRLVLAWLRAFLRLILTALHQALGHPPTVKSGLLTTDALVRDNAVLKALSAQRGRCAAREQGRNAIDPDARSLLILVAHDPEDALAALAAARSAA
jgi:hypothetical protein